MDGGLPARDRTHSLLAPQPGSGSPRSSTGIDLPLGREGVLNVITDDSIQLSHAVVRLLLSDSSRLFFVEPASLHHNDQDAQGCFIIKRLVTVSDLWRMMLGGHKKSPSLATALASPSNMSREKLKRTDS